MAPHAACLPQRSCDHAAEPEQYVCRCLRVTADQIRDAAIYEGASTVRDVIRTTSAGAGCTACHRRIRELLRAAAQQRCEDACEQAQTAVPAA